MALWVKEAKAALEKGDVTRVLKWVAKENEDEIKAVFPQKSWQPDGRGRRPKRSLTGTFLRR